MSQKKQSSNPSTPPTQAPAPSAMASWTVNIGLLAIAVATLMPLINYSFTWFRYIYAFGALLTIIGRLASVNVYRDESLRVRRLARMELWAAIIFGVGAFFTFWKGAGPTDWLAFTLAGAVLQGYASIMIPRALRASDK